MALPILVFVVLNEFNIGIGFLYLSVKPEREQSAEDESALLGRDRDGISHGSGFVFVVGLVINLISRLEGAQASGQRWLFSGRSRC